MTGPEHYREAERLSAISTDVENLAPEQREAVMADLAKAQVHATLALAAATAAPQVDRWIGDESREARAWTQAVS